VSKHDNDGLVNDPSQCPLWAGRLKAVRLCINYDLNKSGKDYAGLIAALERLGAKRACRSTWLLDTSSSERGVYDYLSPYLDKDDFYFSVVITQKPFWTRMFATGAAWINARWA
jgi:hypothetical protein